MTARVLGRVRTIEDLHTIFRERAEELLVTRQSIGRAAMLPTRYANKLLAPHPRKHLGVLSIPGLMEALQLELLAVERHDVPQRVLEKLDKRRVVVSERSVRFVRIISKRFLRDIAKKGGLASRAKLSPKARSISARKASLARWKTVTPAQRTLLARRLNQQRWHPAPATPKPRWGRN